MTKPITPDQVQSEKDLTIPDEIIKVFNHLIVKNWDGRCSIVYQDELLEVVEEAFDANGKGITRQMMQMIFDNRWLDVEPLFKEAGWNVEYDKPAYCESYPATFKFTKK